LGLGVVGLSFALRVASMGGYRMPDPVGNGALTLGCCVDQLQVLLRIREAARLEGHRVVDLEAPDLRVPEGAGGWDALIYDLHPWDERALQVVQRVTRGPHPTPLLLYPPTQAQTVGTLLVRAGATGGEVVALFQQQGAGEVDRLRHSVRALVQTAPRIHLLAAVRECVPGIPPVIDDYTHALFERLNSGENRVDLSVPSIASQVPSTVRSLERSCKAAGLPTPKELSNWMLLIWLAYQAKRTGKPIPAVARRFGVNANKLYRLRRRLLRDACGITGDSSVQGFDEIVEAFRTRCRPGPPPLSQD
jgi:hypothetical protein